MSNTEIATKAERDKIATGDLCTMTIKQSVSATEGCAEEQEGHPAASVWR